MSSKRSKLEIYLNILQILNKNVRKPTRIMYEANLSWTPLQQIIKSMVTQGLIEEVVASKRKEYVITAKGKEVLRYFTGIKNLIKITS